MIYFNDLDLICHINNHFYKLVIDGYTTLPNWCSKCAFYKKTLCNNITCCSVEFNIHFHYEEIPKETCDAMWLFLRKR